MTENAFSVKRLGKLVLLLLCSILFPVICGVLHNVRVDHLIVWSFICLVCFLCFALYVEHERLQGEMSRGISNDYSLLTFIYLICLLGACAGSLLPAFAAPVMALSVLCNGAFRTKLGTALAVIIIVDGILKLQYAVDFYHLQADKWWIELIGAVIMIIVGVVALFNPFSTTEALTIFIGIALMIEGIWDFISLMKIVSVAKKAGKVLSDMKDRADAVDMK